MHLDTHRWVQGWHINASGKLFGGQLLSWVDEDANMVVSLEADPGTQFTTAGIDRASFLAPVKQGDRLHFSSQIIHIGRTSVTVWTNVWITHDKEANTFTKVFDCYVTLVCVDKDGNAVPVLEKLSKRAQKFPEQFQKGHHWKLIDRLKEYRKDNWPTPP